MSLIFTVLDLMGLAVIMPYEDANEGLITLYEADLQSSSVHIFFWNLKVTYTSLALGVINKSKAVHIFTRLPVMFVHIFTTSLFDLSKAVVGFI